MRYLFLALALFSLGACGNLGFPGVYRIDVEQGNIVTQEMVDQLKPGMNRNQVRFILGLFFFGMGIFFGIITGRTIELEMVEDKVLGRYSRISFLLWGLSLVFSMLMNLASSPLASTLGALPLFLTTGMQVSGNFIILQKTNKLRKTAPASP